MSLENYPKQFGRQQIAPHLPVTTDLKHLILQVDGSVLIFWYYLPSSSLKAPSHLKATAVAVISIRGIKLATSDEHTKKTINISKAHQVTANVLRDY